MGGEPKVVFLNLAAVFSLLIFFFFFNLFPGFHLLFVVVSGPNSPTRAQNQAPCIGSMES